MTAHTTTFSPKGSTEERSVKSLVEKHFGRKVSREGVICPRCRRPGTLTFRGQDRVYVYVYHGRSEGKYDICYIGPADGYEYVHRVHGDLALSAADRTDYLEVLELVLTKHFEQMSMHEEADVIEALAGAAQLLAGFCRELEHREKCLRALKDAII